jgi:hypothetical protein
MNLLTGAVRLLNTGLQSLGGESVIYRRGNDSIDLIAVPVRTQHDDYSTEDDLSLTARERDWIIAADELVFDGVMIEPQRLDEIDWIDSLGRKHTYQVLQRAGDRCFRHTDLTLTQLRVYTVERIPNDE